MNKIFGLFLACSFALAAHGAIPFVSGNKTLLKAATGENSTPSEELAFTELANYVKEVFGATLERGEPKNSGIIIATLASKNIPPAVREKLSASKMDDSFYLKTADGKLYIVGKENSGALYGTYEFIEKYLGVCWLYPGTEGEYFRKKSDFTIPDIDSFQEPDFPYRFTTQVGSGGLSPIGRSWAARLRFHVSGTGGFGGWHTEWLQNEKAREFVSARNILHKVADEGGHMTFSKQVSEKEYFSTHPEYFALVNGKRQGPHNCLSNEEVQRIVADYIISLFDRHGTKNIRYIFSTVDSGKGWCECEKCRAMDGNDGTLDQSRRFHQAVQNIARKVYAKHPDAKLVLLAYWNYREFPEGVKIDPRMEVYFCTHQRCHAHYLDDPNCARNVRMLSLMKKWLALNPKMYLYDYENATPGICYSPIEKVLLHDLKLYKKLGLLGRKDEIRLWDARFVGPWKNEPWLTTLSPYENWQFWQIFSKAAWDSSIDLDRTLEDLESKYYGKAYPAMKKYQTLRRTLWENTSGCFEGWGAQNDHRTAKILQKPGAKEQLLKLLDEAHKLAEGDPRIEKRVALDRKFLQHFWIEANEKYRSNLGRTIPAPKCPVPPVIDGVEEPLWASAGWAANFRDRAGREARGDLAAKAAFFSDEENLYVLVSAGESKPEKLTANAPAEKPLPEIWKDDAVEIFVAPPNNAGKYYQFVVNSKGTMAQLEQPGLRQADLGTKAAAKVYRDHFVVELRIPARNLEGVFRSGVLWGIHAARSRKVSDGTQQSWSSIDGIPNHGVTDFRPLLIGEPLITNGSFDQIQNNMPKDWSGKKVEAVPENGGYAVKLNPGGYLLRILYGRAPDRLFMPKQPVPVQIRFKARGKGRIYLQFARYISRGKGRNDPVKSDRSEIFRLTPEMKLCSVDYTIPANEFIQLFFVATGETEAVIDDVSITRR